MSGLTKKAKMFEQWFEELYLAKGGMETQLLRLEDVEAFQKQLQDLLNEFPDVIEPEATLEGAMIFGDLVKAWREKFEKVLGENKK